MNPSQNHLGHLQSRRVRLTGPRKALLALLGKEALPMTAKEIWKKLPTPKSDLVSVYRTLDLFDKENVADRVELGDGLTRYELKRKHHHHVSCTACHKVRDVRLCIDDIEKKVLRQSGFRVLFHDLQLSGLCRSCA